jgi:paraquat-inducible protein A
LGVLIFFTSIAIPAAKILGLAWCLISIRCRSQKHLVMKTKLFRLIDQLGRWSNVDPFTIAVFVPLMNFGSLVNQQGGAGATPFILVVVLTLLASHSFDPRLGSARGRTAQDCSCTRHQSRLHSCKHELRYSGCGDGPPAGSAG